MGINSYERVLELVDSMPNRIQAVIAANEGHYEVLSRSGDDPVARLGIQKTYRKV